MSSSLTGKVAVVTGSSAGIGEAIALLLASRGANVTFTGRDQARLDSVLIKAVNVSGRNQDNFLAVKGDLKDSKVRDDIVDKTVKKFGRLDILVVNAGVPGTTNAFLDYTEQTYNEVLDTNLKSAFFLIQKGVPYLEKTKGNIVNISSIVTSLTSPGFTAYAISKAGLDHLTRCLAVDLGSKGIRVNSINPGFFPILILRDLGDIEKLNEQIGGAERAQQPLKGRIGVSEDVAETVAFLVSDAAGFITGELVKVDGGRSFTGNVTFNLEKK